jgi:hypothetical protein
VVSGVISEYLRGNLSVWNVCVLLMSTGFAMLLIWGGGRGGWMFVTAASAVVLPFGLRYATTNYFAAIAYATGILAVAVLITPWMIRWALLLRSGTHRE